MQDDKPQEDVVPGGQPGTDDGGAGVGVPPAESPAGGAPPPEGEAEGGDKPPEGTPSE